MAFRGKKTQIYLSDEQWRELVRESGAQGVSVASVIRSSIAEHFAKNNRYQAGFENVMAITSGLWSKRKDIEDTEALVRSLRSGWSRRQEREIGAGRLSR